MPIITVTSGTTGSGTTTVATNLAVVLARLGRRVAILDLALPAGTVAQRLGASGAASSVIDGPHGVRIYTGPDDSPTDAGPDAPKSALADALRPLVATSDFIVVDLSARHPLRTTVSALSAHLLVVTGTSAEGPLAARDVIVDLGRRRRRQAVGLIVNGVDSCDEAAPTYRAIATALPGRRLISYGPVTADPQVRRAQMMQRAVVDCRPGCPSSQYFEALGRRIALGSPSGGGQDLFPTAWSVGYRPELEVPRCA